MKPTFITILLWCCGSIVNAQNPLCIGTDKTTSLIFPFDIVHVDRGTMNILAFQVKEAPNTLLLKAGSKNFQETNLSVVTSDGILHSFIVCYDSNPAVLVHHIKTNKAASVSGYANMILDNPRTLHGVTDSRSDMRSEVTGIYIKDNQLYYQLRLHSQSPIGYEIDFIRFYIRDKKKAQRTAIQETEIKPLYTLGNISAVEAFQWNSVVIVLEKFTIPDSKYLAIEIMERNGGRHLFMKVKNNKLIRAIPLPDIK